MMNACKDVLTCREFKIVNIQAKNVVDLLTLSSPNTHVIPRSGRSTTVAMKSCLQSKKLTERNSGKWVMNTGNSPLLGALSPQEGNILKTALK